MVNAELSSSPEPETSEKVSESPASGSEELRDATAELPSIFSLNVEDETEILVGVSLRLLTCKLNAFSKVRPPESLVCSLIA